MSDRKTDTARLLDFEAYTDDTAPDYDGLTVAYTTVVSALLVAATVGVFYALEDTVVGRQADAAFGASGPAVVGVWVGVVVGGAALLTVGRYLSVRAIDSESLPLSAAVTLGQVLSNGLVLTVVVELALGGLSDEAIVVLGTVAVCIVVLGNLLVLATPWDLSAASALGILSLVLFALVAILAQFVWSASTDGLLWFLYLRMWDLNTYVLLPVFFLSMYVHDVWRVAESDLQPTLGALSAYTAAGSLALIPVEYAVGFVLLVLESEE